MPFIFLFFCMIVSSFFFSWRCVLQRTSGKSSFLHFLHYNIYRREFQHLIITGAYTYILMTFDFFRRSWCFFAFTVDLFRKLYIISMFDKIGVIVPFHHQEQNGAKDRREIFF